ncbi:hypothetical protein PBI_CLOVERMINNIE_78 [Gordonia phage CloverMinnie]|nr:hypothetical protein PBI_CLOVERMINNIE_78 [Gordonia phage CloverMinnie]
MKERTTMTIPRPVAPETPECDKLAGVADEGNTVIEFFEWAQAQGYHLVRYEEGMHMGSEITVPVAVNAALLHEWQGLDGDKIEAERRALLDYQRQLNAWADQ